MAGGSAPWISSRAPSVLLQPILRLLRRPQRLRALHPSGVRAALHELVEPDEAETLRRLFGASRDDLAALESDLLTDEALLGEICETHRRVRGTPLTLFARSRSRDACPRFRLLYYAVRLLRPSRCVETGVMDGVSSAVILKALRDNAHGELVSIDLPARRPIPASTRWMEYPVLPEGCDPGWLVPASLRSRWALRIGSSTRLLPEVLERWGAIELFFHDSLHTDAHMSWEYAQAWAALRPGGLLVSDDVFWSAAFARFSASIAAETLTARGVGFARKPADAESRP